VPVWAWLLSGAALVVIVLIALAIRGYPEDGSF
jgi:hypothetical protein